MTNRLYDGSGRTVRQWDAHGLTPQQVESMRDRFESFMPKLSNDLGSVQDVLSGILPKEAALSPGAGANYQAARQATNAAARGHTANLPGGGMGGGGGGGDTFQTVQRPYQPEFESPDRQQYPVHRILANRYFRMFYKLDHVIGNGVDLISELPFGEFELTGEGVEGEVKDIMEYSADEAKLRSNLPFMTREFLVTGEAAPHLFWDDSKGCWTYMALHNPDQLEVIDAPFIRMDPVVEFKPDPRLQKVLNSTNPQLRQVRESMPAELLHRLQSNQNIPLDPNNFTFLPRKLHPYDTRGTSIISRMWRILMYEDSIFNASIATARRHAGPLKVAKLGNPANGWIPGPEEERKLLELLAQAELDVNAWLIYHYGINFELVGTTDRVMTIDKHYELIERVKLVALGISKAFLHGEVTYASAATGLTVFLRRLKAHRTYFEDAFLYPKFWKKMAMVNKWVKPTQAELDSRVRVRRSSSEISEDHRWIIPTMQWSQSLDPTVDSELINAMQTLENMGVRFSKTTKMSLAGRDFEEESKQRLADHKKEQEVFKDYPELLQEDATGGGGGFGGALPPIPGDAFGDDLGGGEPPEPEGASVSATDGAEPSPAKPNPFGNRDRIGMWHKKDVESLVDLMSGNPPDDDPWVDAFHSPKVRDAIKGGDNDEIMEAVEDFLIEEDYPASGIDQLVDILKEMKVVRSASRNERRRLAELAENIQGFGKMDGYDGL